MKGKSMFNSQYIKKEEGRLLRRNALTREQWLRWFHKLDDTMTPAFDLSVVGEVTKWPPCRSLGDVPLKYEVQEAIRALKNRKAVGSDGLPDELLKVLANEGEWVRSARSTRSSSLCGGELDRRDNGKMQRLR